MSTTGFPGEDVDTHLKIHGHLPELECYNAGEPPIVCRNPNYTSTNFDPDDLPKGGVIEIENTPIVSQRRIMQRQHGVRFMRRKKKLERQRRKAGRR